MEENPLTTIINLFRGEEIRSIWDSQNETYYLSVLDVISVLTDSKDPNAYWRKLKQRLKVEGNQTVTNCHSFKMKSKDGKMRMTDTLDMKDIWRLIQSIPSPNAEPFKLWLATLGKERVDEVFDPEIAVNRAISYYRGKGYSDEWIKSRLIGILNRKKLTDVWKEHGITKDYEYAILTNEIYRSWSGLKASEYKRLKGIRKESLRDNMTDIEIILTDLGELTTRDIVKMENPRGLKENLSIAKRGGKASKIAREYYEKETGKEVVTSENSIGGRYQEENEVTVISQG